MSKGFWRARDSRRSLAETLPAIRIRDLVKEFPRPAGTGRGERKATSRDGVENGGLRAVDGLSLEIPEGAFYGLLGPNGAGKTTTIRILTGLGRRTSGRVEVRGMDVSTEFRKVRRLIGLAPQEFDFDQFLTVLQVLRYRGMYFEMTRRAADMRARELVARFGLEHKANVRVQHLSGGQKRRLLIAKSLMHDPDILILDEPTAGIDVSLRHDLWDYLREVNKEGKTILLTTHYIEEAETLCDHIGIIDQGRLIADGTPEALSQRSGSDLVLVRLALPYAGERARLGAQTGLDVEFLEGATLIAARGMRGGQAASRLLEALVGEGVRVDHVEIKRQSLEDAFITLTGRTIAANAEAEARGGNV